MELIREELHKNRSWVHGTTAAGAATDDAWESSTRTGGTREDGAVTNDAQLHVLDLNEEEERAGHWPIVISSLLFPLPALQQRLS